MADRKIDILVQAHDRASGVFGKIGGAAKSLMGSLLSLKTALVGLIASLGAYIGVRSAMRAFVGQEEAITGLRDAIDMAGDSARQQLPDMLAYADQVQAITKHSNNAVLELMDMASRITGRTGPALRNITTAIIGLAARLDVNLREAFRAFKEMAEGNVNVMRKYGITVSETLSPQDRLNKLMEFGAESFALARREGQTTAAVFGRFWHIIDDLRALMAEGLAPILSYVADLFAKNRGRIFELMQTLSDFKERIVIALVKAFTMAELAVRNWSEVSKAVFKWFGENWTNVLAGFVAIAKEAGYRAGEGIVNGLFDLFPSLDKFFLSIYAKWADWFTWMKTMWDGLWGDETWEELAVRAERAAERARAPYEAALEKIAAGKWRLEEPEERKRPSLGEIFHEAALLTELELPEGVVDEYKRLVQERIDIMRTGKPPPQRLPDLSGFQAALGIGAGQARGVAGLRGRLLIGEMAEDPAQRTARAVVDIRKLTEEGLDVEHELLSVTRDILEERRRRRTLDLVGI